MTAAEYMTGAFLPRPAIHESSIARPVGYCGFYRLAFHNIGWNIGSKRPQPTTDNLATAICDMVRHKCVDAMGIGEAFNLRDDYHEKRQDIMEHLLSKLNSSAGQPATSADSNAEQLAVSFVVRSHGQDRADPMGSILKQFANPAHRHCCPR